MGPNESIVFRRAGTLQLAPALSGGHASRYTSESDTNRAPTHNYSFLAYSQCLGLTDVVGDRYFPSSFVHKAALTVRKFKRNQRAYTGLSGFILPELCRVSCGLRPLLAY